MASTGTRNFLLLRAGRIKFTHIKIDTAMKDNTAAIIDHGHATNALHSDGAGDPVLLGVRR
jgi:hypothetical protein